MKLVTPMKKVSQEMKDLRDLFKSLNYEHVQLNKTDGKITTYIDQSDWLLHDITSVKEKVESDRIELFLKETQIPSKIGVNKIVFGISFNYLGEEKEKVINLSFTDNIYINKNKQRYKIVKSAVHSNSLSIYEFKEFTKKALDLFKDEKISIEDFKSWFEENYITYSFVEKDKKIKRQLTKLIKD